jgi:tetratricopeptide (TPR) repeat protein
MRRTAYLGCSLLMVSALMVPSLGWAQAPPNSDDAYRDFYAQQDPQKKAQMGEKFLTDFKDSQYKDPVYRTLITIYEKASNWNKVIEVATKIDQWLPAATPQTKASTYAKAMTAAQQSNNAAQTISFGEKVLAIAPNDVNTLITLATTIPRALPTDAAGKTASLEKAQKYATQSLAEVGKLDAKSAGLSEADWTAFRSTTEGTLHSTLGEISYDRMEYDKAIEEFTTAIKTLPKDGTSWYLMGLSLDQQGNALTKRYLDAVKATNEAVSAHADKVQIDDMKAQSDGLEQALRAKREEAINALASAVAFGVETARPRLQTLYKTKNNDSLDGLDQLIASKKK